MKSFRRFTKGINRFGSLPLVGLPAIVIFLMIGENASAASFSAGMAMT